MTHSCGFRISLLRSSLPTNRGLARASLLLRNQVLASSPMKLNQNLNFFASGVLFIQLKVQPHVFPGISLPQVLLGARCLHLSETLTAHHRMESKRLLSSTLQCLPSTPLVTFTVATTENRRRYSQSKETLSPCLVGWTASGHTRWIGITFVGKYKTHSTTGSASDTHAEYAISETGLKG